MPNAKPEYSSGSMPDMASTLGSTMPQPRISSQPVFLHMRQPSPWQMPQLTSTSADGSVNGKKCARNRVLRSGPNTCLHR